MTTTPTTQATTPSNEPTTKPKMAAKQIIMQKLLAGEIISPLSALNDFGGLSLPQRISELRARGEPIQGRMVTEPNGKRHNIYWIEPKDRQPAHRGGVGKKFRAFCRRTAPLPKFLRPQN